LGNGSDQAAVFGSQVETFILPDGSEASIHQLNANYSLRLQRHSRVIDINNATMVRFRSAQTVGGYLLIVLEKSERNCAVKTHLLAIQGAEVRSWEFGDCSRWPETSILSDVANFDVQDGQKIVRYEFSNGHLRYGDAPGSSAQIFPRQTPSESYQPKSSDKAANTSPPVPQQRDAQAGPSRGPVQLPSVQNPPIFKSKEKAAQTIYLDRP
jgi:hypothetical protein